MNRELDHTAAPVCRATMRKSATLGRDRPQHNEDEEIDEEDE
jgi:hypothetical protein